MQHRSGEPYDPGADAARRFPDWVIRRRQIAPIPEVMCVRRKVILLDDAADKATRRCALAHALAHLDLGHTPDSGRQGRRYELEADRLAAERLIPLSVLADTLAWALGADEVADALTVTERLAWVRVRYLTEEEKKWIEGRIERTEHVA